MKKNVYLKLVFLVLLSIIGKNISAQLSLKQTNWNGVTKLSFSNDTLTVSDKTTQLVIYTTSYKQNNDTLIFNDSVDKGNCKAEPGLYGLKYQHSGQQLFLKLIKDNCSDRKKLFDNGILLNFIPDQNSAARDWLKLDAEIDSVVGISLYKAYELLKGRKSKTVVVAVIDNGVDLSHEDLKNSIWTNTKEIPGNGIDDDHNGYVDDVHGWNFRGLKDGTIVENEQSGATQEYVAWKNKYDHADTNKLRTDERKEWSIYIKAKKEYLEKISKSKDSTELKYAYNINYNSSELIGDEPVNINDRYYGSSFIKLSPNLSHGTHVSGIIAAEQNNHKGIDGIADNVLIMPIVASTAVGDERDKDVANAILYAVNNGASVINISFSKVFSPFKNILDKAIRYAEEKNVLIIHCAGNDGVNIDSITNYRYPMAIYENGKKANNFITVGWSRPLFNYRLAHPHSNYGKKNVDVFAPGSDIFSTIPANEYDFKSGSSMSAPCVSGLAALLLSYFPSLSIFQVKDIILKSSFKPDIMVNRPGSTQKVPFSSLSATGGIVNAYNAVSMAIKWSLSQ